MAISQLVQPRAFRYVEAVARLGSIRRAAEALNIASSAVNRMILELERALDAQLFERLPRGVRLTSAGEFLLLHIRRSHGDFESVREQIDGLKGVQRGHVTIAAVEAAIEPFLARTLAAFHLNHRRISYRVRIAGSIDVANAVVQEQADLGLTLNASASARLLTLATAPYFLHAFVASSHPLARRRSLRLSDCAGFPIAMGDETLGGRQRLERVFDQTSLDFRPFLAANSVALMAETGKYSDAICFQALPRPLRSLCGKLVAIPLADRDIGELELALIANKRRALSAAVATLGTELSRAIREAAYPPLTNLPPPEAGRHAPPRRTPTRVGAQG
jgi:DNA-binding transcriptional LysR family regulator